MECTFPGGKDLAGILERRKAAQKVKDDDTTTFAALIFHHDGRAIVSIKKSWQTACVAAGTGKMVCRICGREGIEKKCPHCKKPCKYVGRIFHDLRRSFCKNADEAGISRDVARSISGHRTDATYSRYNISDTKRKRKSLELLQEFREAQAAQAAQESSVVAMR